MTFGWAVTIWIALSALYITGLFSAGRLAQRASARAEEKELLDTSSHHLYAPGTRVAWPNSPPTKKPLPPSLVKRLVDVRFIRLKRKIASACNKEEG